ncbi:MAG: M1 family metallopeptidase [Chloroflexi bacterium]|nr:M1 family metallopeptidase [Chloroflexota bacterium]
MPALLVLLVVGMLGVAVAPGVGIAAPVAADAPTPAAAYRMDLSVNIAAGTAQVGQTVRLRNDVGAPLERLVFRSPAAADGSLSLRSASVAGQPVSPRLDGSILELPLPQPLAAGATVQADLAFSLQIPNTPGRLAKTPRGITMGYWFPMLTVHRGEWDRRPFIDVGDATFSEVAGFDVTVTTSEPAIVMATGERVEQDGRRSRFVGASVRDFALAISPEYTVRRAKVGDLTLEVAAFGEDRAAYYATRGADLLTWAAGKFGPLPYSTLTVADADLPSSYGGLEYPTLIVLARGYSLPADPAGSALDSLFLHELLHQWFYSLVGNDQIADPWLDEAFVTYLTYAYYREQAPALAPAVYERTIAGGSGGAVDSTVYDFPSDGPYFGVVYRRGARFLEALHERLGDPAFWRLLREHVDAHRDRVGTPRAFLERAQAASSSSLNPLIAAYLSYGAFQPTTPRVWSVDTPDGPWTGTASLFVAAEFPVTRVQVLLDSRILADGPTNNLTLDLAGVEAGQYVLLVRVWDHENVLFERTRRVEVSR